MICPDLPVDEDVRLAALRKYDILDTDPEEAFDRITRLASELLDMPVALISLVDEGRQWFKSAFGLQASETPRDVSFCGHAILGQDVMVVDDAEADQRFHDNPLVSGDMHVRFYAGAPLRSRDGHAIGTLCVLDAAPRHLADSQRKMLADMADMVIDAMELRLALRSAQEENAVRKRMQAQLAKSEARYRGILNTAADGIITITDHGIIESVNRAAEAIFGYPAAQMIGRNVSMLMPEPDRGRHDGYIGKYLGGGAPKVINHGREVTGLRKDGVRVPLHLSVGELVLDDGSRIFTGILRDITELKRAQEERLRSETLLRAVIEGSPDPIFAKDVRGRYTLLNRAAAKNLGMPAELALGHADEELFPADMAREIGRIDREILERGEMRQIEEEIPHSSGNATLLVAKSPLRSPEGEIVGLVGIGRDITERKKTENDLRKLSQAVEQSGSMVIITGIDGTIEYVNRRFLEVTGYQRDEIVGQKPRVLSSGEKQPEEYGLLWETITSGRDWQGEFHNKRRDGSLYWVAAKISPIKAEDGSITHFLSIEDDITEKKAAAASLQQVQERLITALEAIDDGFALYDRDDRLVLCNSRYREMYHKSAEFMVPGTPFEVILREGAQRGQYMDGRKRVDDWIAERLASHRSANAVQEHQLCDGRWVRVTERETRDGGRVGLRVDITPLKLAQEKLRQAKEEADKANRAKSDFLSSMSHELRTPMNAILGFGQMLQYLPDSPLTPSQARCVEHILKGGEHLLQLINEILDLARIEAGKVTLSIEDVALDGVIKECLSLTQSLADKRAITLNSASGDQGLRVRADYTRLKQVLLNLISNAIKYNREGGRVDLTCSESGPGMLRVRVTDTGPGIPADRQGELFKPFSRLGAEGSEIEGTGIGLTITRQLVELMGGSIGLVSVVGEGTSFWVDLPLAEREVTAVELSVAATEAGDEGAIARRGTLLYVEDNPANLQLMEMIAGNLRHLTMLSAHNAELGLELAECHLPDLIFMDINLPGMSGLEALQKLRANPLTRHIPVIALTANATRRDIERGVEAGFNQYLTKPIKVDEVIAIIRKVIEGNDRE